MAALLETSGLTRTFGKFTAVENVALHVEEGDVYGFLGLNGAGKTTTIRMLLRLIRPTSGNVTMFGMDTRTHFTTIMKEVGALIELPAYYPYLSGYKNMDVYRWWSGGIPARRIMECLEMVGLEKHIHRKVGYYSQGMRQRLAIAMALLSSPKLVLLDEPLNGLDPHGIESIRTMIERLNGEEGVSFFISSHLLHEVEMSCNRVGIIKDGKLVVQDTVENLLSDTAGMVQITADPREEAITCLQKWGKAVPSPEGERIQFQGKPEELAAVNADLVKNNIRVSAFTPERMTLEKYFLSR